MTRLTVGATPLIVMSGILCGTFGGVSQVRAADVALKPIISVSQEYNDNINETALNRTTDLITRVQPGFTLHYNAPDSFLDAGYNLDYLKFDRGTQGDQVNQQGLLKGSTALYRNFLFLDLNDTMSRVSLDVARDVTADSAVANQTDQNLATAAPYLLWRYADNGSLKTGYSYTDMRYWHTAGADTLDRSQQDATALLSQEVHPKLTLSVQYTFSHVQSQGNGYDSHTALGGPRYQYADGCFIFGSIGNSWQVFSDGTRTSYLTWDAGLTHDFRVLVLSLESKSSVNTNPQSVSVTPASPAVSATPVLLTTPAQVNPLSISTKVTIQSVNLDRKLERGAIGLYGSYAQYVDTQTGGNDLTSITLGASGHMELRPSLTVSLSASGDKVTGPETTELPYHFTGIAALNYAFNHDLTAGLTYTRVMYRYEPENTAGSINVNRVVLSLNKAF